MQVGSRGLHAVEPIRDIFHLDKLPVHSTHLWEAFWLDLVSDCNVAW